MILASYLFSDYAHLSTLREAMHDDNMGRKYQLLTVIVMIMFMRLRLINSILMLLFCHVTS